MHEVTEEVFADMLGAGAIQQTEVVMAGERALVLFRTLTGHTGRIHTARGQVKQYLPGTALRVLKHLGVGEAVVKMQGWTPGQRSLL